LLRSKIVVSCDGRLVTVKQIVLLWAGRRPFHFVASPQRVHRLDRLEFLLGTTPRMPSRMTLITPQFFDRGGIAAVNCAP